MTGLTRPRAAIEHLWRRLTDRRVCCVRCGAAVGYVVRRGHAAWVCAGCSGTGQEEPAYPVRGWSWTPIEEAPG